MVLDLVVKPKGANAILKLNGNITKWSITFRKLPIVVNKTLHPFDNFQNICE
jgi:hypothetical protein